MALELFESLFVSNNGEPLLDETDRELALLIYEIACEVFQSDQNNSREETNDDGNNNTDDIASDINFIDKIEATKKNFIRIVEQFKKTTRAKDAFLKNFVIWAPACKKHIKVLREAAEEIHSDKFNGDIAKLVGIVVGALGGIALALSYATPLAAVTVPLTVGGGVACGLGGGVAVGTGTTQIILLKQKFNEVKSIIKEHEEKFSLMARWFTIPDELKNALESLISYDILKVIKEEFNKFFAEMSRETKVKADRFKAVLRFCLRAMNRSNRLTSEFADELTPVVQVFIIFVCVLKGRNRMVLDCIMINKNLALSLTTILNITGPTKFAANGLVRGIAELGDDVFKVACTRILACINVAIDLWCMVLISIEIHNRPEPEQTKKIKEVAEQLEEMFLAIEKVYNATKNSGSTEWISIIVTSVPDDAGQDDIKSAVKPHLPEITWNSIKPKRLKTRGNNWILKVPTSHSEHLLRQTRLIIKENVCEVIA